MAKNDIEYSAPMSQELGDKFEALNFIVTYLGQKWFIPVLAILHSKGECRYSFIQRQLPAISKKALSNVLQSMERYGLVIRIIKLSHPPQVTYSLSKRAHSLLEELQKLDIWGRENRPLMESDAAEFDESLAMEMRTPWQQ